MGKFLAVLTLAINLVFPVYVDEVLDVKGYTVDTEEVEEDKNGNK